MSIKSEEQRTIRDQIVAALHQTLRGQMYNYNRIHSMFNVMLALLQEASILNSKFSYEQSHSSRLIRNNWRKSLYFQPLALATVRGP